MGILYNNARLLCSARKSGVSFENTLTIGNLDLYLSLRQISELVNHFNLNVGVGALQPSRYSKQFFEQALGAEKVSALDYSDYQGSEIIHDLNFPVSPDLHGKFDCVVDGGSIEHVYNVPVAIANYMNLIKCGGSIFIFTACNNHCGHGFFQFSPEFFFRTFNEDNGFEVRDLIIDIHKFPGPELGRPGKCFSVADPVKTQGRVGLVNRSPVLVMMHAVKVEAKVPFSRYPLQSDYSAIYQESASEATLSASPKRRIMKQMFRSLPLFVQERAIGLKQLLTDSTRNRRFYKPWNPS